MTSRWRQREFSRPSTWRQSLLFNSLILLIPIFAARIIASAYTSDIATDPMSFEARTETRAAIEDEFSGLSGPTGSERVTWARRIDETLNSRDFSAARGYLLAAPFMLDRQDAAAVLAAADAEERGTRDQRLARAALLFLPDDVRASYERAIAPPDLEAPLPTEAPEESNDPASAEAAETEAAPSEEADTASEADVSTDVEPLSGQRTFSMIGDAADLTRRSQGWLGGESVDSVQLRLRALGLLMQAEEGEDAEAFVEAASIVRAAHRAGRLSERFNRYLTSRIEDALPEDLLRTELNETFQGVMTTQQRASEVLIAYQNAIQPEALNRLDRDMAIIARLADLTSSSGAITLVEQARTPEDMRRALLLTEAGGDRSVALARELGSKVLDLAQIGVKWSGMLVLQVMALMALGMALIWTTLSALMQAETVRFSRP